MRHVTRQGLVVAPPDARQGAHGTAAETVAAAVAERLRGFPAERDGLVLTNRRAWPINRGSFNALGESRRSARRGRAGPGERHARAQAPPRERAPGRGVSIRGLADYLGHVDPASRCGSTPT
ncbi:MAG: hypothetical protein H0V05_09885 [Euzebyaceae bacterium]|nr:hypothetical protein [Euzebyaceae bacterium]